MTSHDVKRLVMIVDNGWKVWNLEITWIVFQNAFDSFWFFQENSRLGAMADWGMSGAGLELWQEQLNNEMRWTLL